MGILNRVLETVTRIRIAFDFRRSEARARQVHAACAEQKFSNAELLRQRDQLSCGIERDADTRFRARQVDLESQRQRTVLSLEVARQRQGILERDYRRELSAAYERRRTLIDERRDCSRSLSQSYGDLEDAKTARDAWYSKAESKGLFGNGGKGLPKSSLFRQDLADRDRYKSDRDSSRTEIGSLRQSRDGIDSDLDELSRTIGELKQGQAEMHALRDAGHDRHAVRLEICTAGEDLGQLERDIQATIIARSRFVAAERHTRGVAAMDAELEVLRADKGAYIAEFDDPRKVCERRIAHQQEWFRSRGGAAQRNPG